MAYANPFNRRPFEQRRRVESNIPSPPEDDSARIKHVPNFCFNDALSPTLIRSVDKITDALSPHVVPKNHFDQSVSLTHVLRRDAFNCNNNDDAFSYFTRSPEYVTLRYTNNAPTPVNYAATARRAVTPSDMDNLIESMETFSLRSGTSEQQQRSPSSQSSQVCDTCILCISNIPWDLTPREVVTWLTPYPISMWDVHLLMDRSPDPAARTVGKTLSDAFVRFPRSHLTLVMHTHQARMLKARQVQLRIASPDELFRRMFPLREGNVYLTRGEIAAILMVCKNYKLHYSRKCADRPYENIMSVLLLIPWSDEARKPTTLHRDHLFEMMKVSMEVLSFHMQKEYYHNSKDLMPRLVRCGLTCPGFTVKQKQVLLEISGLQCPNDLKHHLIVPEILMTSAGPHLVDADEATLQKVSAELPVGLSTFRQNEKLKTKEAEMSRSESSETLVSGSESTYWRSKTEQLEMRLKMMEAEVKWWRERGSRGSAPSGDDLDDLFSQ